MEEEVDEMVLTGPSAYELERLEKIRRNAEVTMKAYIFPLVLVNAPCQTTWRGEIEETRKVPTLASPVPLLQGTTRVRSAFPSLKNAYWGMGKYVELVV